MTILDRLIDEIRSTGGPVHTGDLATRLGLQASALDGMLDLLARKGLLAAPDDDASSEGYACGQDCGHLCAGARSCPFVVEVAARRWVAVPGPG